MSDSDFSDSDEEYVPGAELSEGDVESGEDEDFVGEDDESPQKNKKKSKKKEVTSRKRKGGIKLDDEASGDAEEEEKADEKVADELEEIKKEKQVEQEKKKSDDLWSSFLSDVGRKPKPKPSSNTPASSSPANVKAKEKTVEEKPIEKSKAQPEKMKITKVFDFAGEAVTVTKEVDINSKEAKAELKKEEKAKANEEETPKTSGCVPGVKKPSGGLGGVLNIIGKKNKMSVLEKSKLDWDSFKQKEGIDEDLKIHNRGKDGYIERKRFLERTDMREFENEKKARLGTSKR